MSESENIPPEKESAELGPEQPFLSHLIEFRQRLIRIVLVVLGIFFPLTFISDRLFTWLATPLMSRMPQGTNMIATEVLSPFLTPFKLAFLAAIFLSVPYLLWQIWAFIAPGLYRHERRMAFPLMIMSTVLFYLGVAFAYFAVMPLVFRFIISAQPTGVAVMTDISHYLDFVITVFFAFGAAFEIPVAIILIVWTGMSTPEDLIKARPYVLVGVFAVAAVVTPPDVLSQLLLAIPAYLLFELGVVLSRFMVPKHPPYSAEAPPRE